jgi:hypothetical protein
VSLAEKIKVNLYWVPSLLMKGSGLWKFINITYTSELFNDFGLQDKILYIRVVEFISIVFFLNRTTMLVGFFLICTFWGRVISRSIVANVAKFLPIGICSSLD